MELAWKELLSGAIGWKTLVAGPEAASPLLLLPGALGDAEAVLPGIVALARLRRVLAPCYPADATTRERLEAGLLALLDGQGIARATLLGVSFGGQLAQWFVRRRPERCDGLILVGSGAPDPRRGRAIARTLPLWRLLPPGILRARWRREVAGLLSRDDAATHDADADTRLRASTQAARERCLAVVARMSRADLLAARARLAVLDAAAVAPEDLAAWPGRILLLELAADEVIAQEERQRVRELHPQAVVEVVPLLGHAATLTWPPPLLASIERWLSPTSP